MQNLKYFMQKILRPNQKIFSDDVFLVSFPKSGNTWLRFLLAYCMFDLEPGSVDFYNIESYIPDMHVRWPDRKLKRPRVIKSHKTFTNDYPRVIYLYRDGRDVMVSYYYHSVQRNQFSGSFRQFVNNFRSSFGYWGEHVRGWLDRDDLSCVFSLSYEQLKKNPFLTLSNVLNFIGVKVSSKKIQTAIIASSFQSMRDTEQEKGLPPYFHAEGQQFVRKGEIGGWKVEFDSDSLSVFLARESATLKWLGYEI